MRRNLHQQYWIWPIQYSFQCSKVITFYFSNWFQVQPWNTHYSRWLLYLYHGHWNLPRYLKSIALRHYQEDFRPPTSLGYSLFNHKYAFRSIIHVALLTANRVSMVVADDLVPTWHQAICNRHADSGPPVDAYTMSPTYRYFYFNSREYTWWLNYLNSQEFLCEIVDEIHGQIGMATYRWQHPFMQRLWN